MCLSKVNEQYDHPSSLIVGGWKDFGGSSAQPQFQNEMLRGSKMAPVDQWLKAESSIQIVASDRKKYEAGFHVYEEEPKSTFNSRRRVFVRFVSSKGDEDGQTVLIAREMYIPSDANGWPPKPGEPTPPAKKTSVIDKAKSMLKPGNA